MLPGGLRFDSRTGYTFIFTRCSYRIHFEIEFRFEIEFGFEIEFWGSEFDLKSKKFFRFQIEFQKLAYLYI